MDGATCPIDGAPDPDRVETLFRNDLDLLYRRSDAVFSWLIPAQWVAAIATAWLASPYCWHDKLDVASHPMGSATLVGGLFTLPTVLLTWRRPGWVGTRYAVVVSMAAFSALFVHLTAGRTETHFQIFAMLASIAYYRSWRMLAVATLLTLVDHVLRGALWPESLYGTVHPGNWQLAENAWWMLFEDVILATGMFYKRREMLTLAMRHVELEDFSERIEDEVNVRTRQLNIANDEYRTLVESTRAIPWRWSHAEERFSYVGPQAPMMLGFPVDVCLQPDFLPTYLHPDDRERVLHRLQTTEASREDIEMRLCPGEELCLWIRAIVGERHALGNADSAGVMIDITEQRRMALELLQAQKLESVGRLASGIAHEINTPIQYTSDSVNFVRDGLGSVITLLDAYRSVPAQAPVTAHELAQLQALEEAADLDYLRDRLPKALDRAMEGLTRVANLVRSMKEFAHADQKEKVNSDINHVLTTTLTIANNEYKYVADVTTHFGASTPVPCHVSEISQAFLNLIVNAGHAIADVVRDSHNRGTIVIDTSQEGGHVVISIADTGGGIPKRVQPHIFEPFFTTKELGRGTGQGLAIARNIVVDKHGGTLTYITEEGRGTCFTVRLPISSPRSGVHP